MGGTRIVITRFGNPDVLSIIVHGAGGAVGTAFLQLGNLFGLEMFGTASKSKHKTVQALGAVPIDYRSEDFVEVIRSLKPEGVDAAFDPIGGAAAQRQVGRFLFDSPMAGETSRLVSKRPM